jgi:hypothetical protein
VTADPADAQPSTGLLACLPAPFHEPNDQDKCRQPDDNNPIFKLELSDMSLIKQERGDVLPQPKPTDLKKLQAARP